MRQPRPNPRLVKIHRSYSVEEITDLFGVHKNTVRAWVKAGLPTCDERRPMLVLGQELADFLYHRRTKNKVSCKAGEMYCVRCRVPRAPAADMADFEPITDKVGLLKGLCPVCLCMMNRRVNMAKVDDGCSKFAVSFPKAPCQVSNRNELSVNSGFKREA